MLDRIIGYSLKNKLIILLASATIIGFGIYSLMNIPIGAVPDVTNNQVQIITTSRNLATEDVEKFLTYPVELEMANLPGVKEIRSVSKFGLSVVTVVFDDNIGTYLPRQLIAEKIKSAEEKIPAGFGSPSMGPVSTGLGEIYQYVIDVDPEYQDEYTIMDIRTIQDWIIKRQLSGIPGVVEVNTWGGFLKQYEVAVNPERLRAMNLSISEIFTVLENNNSIAGGGYIEKTNESYFIRGEGLVTSLEDIENIVIENRDGIPVFMRDVAEVGFGFANRFGAITGNGEGEKVLGQIMMLKGANSSAVIEAVKIRVAEVQKLLPPGISINGFLERSELIDKTTMTISENLILGCLIVIFVVVLLLGNLRSGLVIASVIPLSLLFAISLMYIFGVDANLMSLGAIDFGIIIDGAVIIVEFIAYKITSERAQVLSLPLEERQSYIDKITFNGASKMMHSAVFGQLIIIIVFIPILSLVNVEGKMFRPMALVFVFALVGAMILCFTYVPVMASMFIKPGDPSKKNISTRLILFLEKLYQPTISWALRSKGWVIGMALALLVSVALLFSTMGGEFVPTLDEGDFVIQPVLKTGTSLTKTVEATTQMEKILIGFPEVQQVVSRIGAAEVPTDPMSMEESDVIIKLKPKSEWVTAKSKDELADQFKSALSVIPGVDYEFTQPIEMRFNELITGVRADLAIKVFGEDLDVLYHKGKEIENAIRNVPGAADIIVEKIAGLPQMSVVYERQKIAKYGLNVRDLNRVITMGFAGMTAGSVFEGEKQFDLVVRFDKDHRKEIENIEKATILLPDGNKLPLSEFASIRYSKGPAKISRDNTKRRIVVGVNVRNRDLESVVKDVQDIIDRDIDLPAGYSIAYGGQFENLRTARARLMVAVPIALLLIFIFLHFAFNSIKDALIIFTAIPLSAVGGVLLLYIRGMPFSISAGVGFIALFGIAVLNGIVLIEEFKELKIQGIKNINKRILLGTNKRMRPVLLTAAAAALGFLPMAVSTSAGAEVQRPLATVVVGGLISATLLTLVVLPVLYAFFDGRTVKPKLSIKPAVLIIILMGFMLIPLSGQTQSRVINLDEAVEIAANNNKGLNASEERIVQSEQLMGSAFDINKTQLYFSRDQNNIAANDLPLNVWGITQALEFPTIYGARKKVLKSYYLQSKNEYSINKKLIYKEVSKSYQEILYWKSVVSNYQYLDSLYKQFFEAANRMFEEGETNYLEKLIAETKQKDIAVKLEQSRESVEKSYLNLYQWMQSDTLYTIADDSLSRIKVLPLDSMDHPGIQYYIENENLYRNAKRVEQQLLLPDLHFSIFQGTNNGPDARRYNGFTAGIGIPLLFGAQKSRIQASKTAVLVHEAERENYLIQLKSNYKSLLSDINKYAEGLDYYNQTGKDLSRALILNAQKAFQNGEIDSLQYVQLLESAVSIEMTYLETLFQYNLKVLDANYIMN